MKKFFTLLLLAFLTQVGTLSAKTSETTLWSGSSDNGAEINLESSKFSSAKEGDAIRITFSFTEAGSMHLCYKTGVDGDWNAKKIDGIDEWPNFSDTNVTTTEYAINATALTTLQEYGMYIYGFTSSTITKVELISEITTSGETELLTETKTFTESWEWAEFSSQSNAKIGDVIRLTYKAYKDEGTEWPYVQFKIKDSNNEDFVTFVISSKINSVNTYDFEITNAIDLEKIRSGGFKINGTLFILTSVKLLTYADSYDAVSVTIGSDGIATWSHTKNLDFTDTGITAYYASDVNPGTVTLTSTATTWNYCGYILKGSAGTYTVKAVADKDASYPAATYLKGQTSEGTVAASANGKFHYIFAKKKDGDSETIGFYKLESDHTLAAHKAYLETTWDITPTPSSPTLSSTRGITLDFGDGTTAILKVIDDGDARQIENNDGKYYTLQGTSMQAPTRKGLYILNGKKVLVK